MARTGGRWPSFYGEGVTSKQSSDVVFRLTFFGEATFRVEGREVDPRRLFIARASAMRAITEGTAATVLLPRRARRPDFGVGAWAVAVASYRRGRGWEGIGGWWGSGRRRGRRRPGWWRAAAAFRFRVAGAPMATGPRGGDLNTHILSS